MRAPTRSETRAVLAALVSGETVPRHASDWALRWVGAVSPEVDDEPVWEALLKLSGADLEVAPQVLLLSPVEYQVWLDEFDRTTADTPT